MKTTLDLPDELMRAAKIRAAQCNLRLKDVVADALRAALGDSGGTGALRAASDVGRDSGFATTAGVKRATASAGQRRQRFEALLAQLDRVPDRPDAADPLAWDAIGLPK